MSKEYNYVITLRRPDAVLFNFISQLMIVLSLVAFISTGMYAPRPSSYYFVLISALIILSWVYVQFLAKREFISYRIPLVIAALGWFYEPGFYKIVAALLVIAFLLERQVKFAEEIGVDDEGITFNSFPSKSYSWDQLTNVVIKEGMITVDFSNNKLLQKELESDVSSELEKEFNEFCSKKLKKLPS